MSVKASPSRFSAGDYADQCWPQLESAIRQMLAIRAEQHSTVSFEQVYSRVYKCVCQHLSDQLYSDLKSLIEAHLEKVMEQLEEIRAEVDFLLGFNEASSEYRRAVQQISLVFTYLNRFYIEPKLHTTLLKVLTTEFTKLVSDKCLDRLLGVMTTAMASPFVISPAIMSSVVKELYALKPEYARSAPTLFATYIPNILPAMGLEDIATHCIEVRMIQERLIHEGFSRINNPLKRTLEYDKVCEHT